MRALAVETRPARLLGPAVGIFVTIRRGACPFHGILLAECEAGVGLEAATPRPIPPVSRPSFPINGPLEA